MRPMSGHCSWRPPYWGHCFEALGMRDLPSLEKYFSGKNALSVVTSPQYTLKEGSGDRFM